MSAFTGLDARRICIIKPSALGDVVQSLPILRPLRDRFPAASISWVVSGGLAGLLEGHERIDDLILFDRRGGLRGMAVLLRRLREGRFDLAIDLQGLLRTGLMIRATAAPVRIGLQTAREGSRLACTTVLPGSGRDVPARLRYWRIAEELGDASHAATADLPLTRTDRDWAAGQLRSLPRPWLAICPGARWATKRWPVTSFATLAARAHAEFGASAVVLGAPDERTLCHDLETQLRSRLPRKAILNLAGQTSLRQLAAVLESAHWAAANDSGPMHLADAVGTPVLGLFTCTSPWLSGPPLDRHELLSTRLMCAASYHKSCPLAAPRRHACHGELSVDRAWEGFVRLARRSRSNRRAAA